MLEKIKSFFVHLYTELVKINDSPQRLALGFGLGVFLGILPGTGPVAALTLAIIFRLNKAAALLGAVLTNSWLSLVTFTLALRAGAAVCGMQWKMVYDQAHELWAHFSWKALWDASLVNIVKPLLIGYALVGFLCGLMAYVLVLILLRRRKGAVG